MKASAKACLAGLFSADGNHQSNTSQREWPAIPLHFVPVEEDYIMKFEKPCKQYDKLLVQQINPKIYDGLFVKYASLLQYLNDYSGQDIKTFSDLLYVYDTLAVEKELGFE